MNEIENKLQEIKKSIEELNVLVAECDAIVDDVRGRFQKASEEMSGYITDLEILEALDASVIK